MGLSRDRNETRRGLDQTAATAADRLAQPAYIVGTPQAASRVPVTAGTTGGGDGLHASALDVGNGTS